MAISIRVAFLATAATSCAAARMSGSLMSAYEDFRQMFGVERDQADHSRRAALFERRRQEVRKHNSQPGILWFASMNKFADYTDEEFHGMLGHRLSRRALDADAPRPVRAASLSLLQTQSQPMAPLAQMVDWRQKLNRTVLAKDQGSCGSCWAVAAAGAVETLLEMISPDAPSVSYEQLVDCVPNPKKCGGTGGCDGATAELAFDYMEKNFLSRAEDYHGYQTGGDGSCRQPTQGAIRVGSFVRLPENEPEDLRNAVATQGPVVVSADASNWMMYGGGIFDQCDRDATINHAILLMGYGTEKKTDYWLIRNSWGQYWGEGGFIRVHRHSGEDKYCGVDHKPSDGVGCEGGPPTLPVCGMCGLLADSAYPKDVTVA